MTKIASLARKLASAGLLTAALLASVAPADAREVRRDELPAPAAPASAASAEPQQTSATFGDWIVRCDRAAGGRRLCEVAQSLTVKGQGSPFAQIAFGRSGEDSTDGKATGEPGLTVLLPVNVAFDKPPRLSGADEGGGVTLSFRRCVPVGCVATGRPDGALMKELRDARKPGRLSFTDAAERTLVLPISFQGLAQALDDYGKEAAKDGLAR